MTTENIKMLHDAIALAGKPAGFTKKGTNWYANRNDSILLINPQKSQYSQRYYLNVGIFFRQLGSTITPKETDCHLRARLTALGSAVDRKRTEELLNFEIQIAADTRVNEIVSIVKTNALPFLERCSSVEGCRAALADGDLDALPVVVELRELLEGKSN